MTYVEEQFAEIPKEVFTFMPIAEFLLIPESGSVDHLIGELLSFSWAVTIQ